MSAPLNRFSNFMALAMPAAGLLTCGAANAATDMYIKFDGVDGEFAGTGYEKQVEVLSWSWGATQQATVGGGGGAGKVSMQDFHFTCKVSSASPPLMLACATGQHIPTATFRFLRPTATGGSQEYYVVTLSDVLVSSFSSSRPDPVAGTPDKVPVERFSLNFAKIQVEYRPAATGTTGGNPVTATIDVVR
jgi:type VI secretion system secreted protein Hcp